MTRGDKSVYNIPMEKPSSRPHQTRTARNQMLDILSRRDHSEKELRDKLQAGFPSEEIEKAIQFAKEKGWLPSSPEDNLRQSEKIAAELSRRGKGQVYINHYLEKKGLGPVSMDSAAELEKAIELVKNKFSDFQQMDQKEKTRVARFLASRGFDFETVRKVINEHIE
jgi:regulatory protein